jgi:hypothetical protein
MSTRLFASVCLLSVAVFLGCSSSDVTRFDVSGTVTFDGQPVPAGTISFQPAAGNEGPGGSAEIKDGKFDTAQGGKAPTGGPHRVVISGYDGNADPDNELPLGKTLFEQYETQVDLPKEDTTEDFEVPPQPAPRARPAAPDEPV